MATAKKNPESIVREIKRKTRRVFNAEEKIRINSEKIAQLLRSRMPPEARVLVLKYGNYRLGGPVESLMLR